MVVVSTPQGDGFRSAIRPGFFIAKGKSIYDGCLPVILHSSELQHYRLATGRAAVTRIKAAAC